MLILNFFVMHCLLNPGEYGAGVTRYETRWTDNTVRVKRAAGRRTGVRYSLNGVSITGVSVEVTGSPCSCKGSNWMYLYDNYIY